MDGNEHAMVLTDADGNPLADITSVTWDNALIAGPVDGPASQPLKDLFVDQAAPTLAQYSGLTDASGAVEVDYTVWTDGTHFAVNTDMDGTKYAMVLTDADGNPLADITSVTWDNALIAGPVDGPASQPLKDLLLTHIPTGTVFRAGIDVSGAVEADYTVWTTAPLRCYAYR